MGCQVKLTLIAKVGLTLPMQRRQSSTVNEKTVALLLNSHGSAEHIMHDVQQYRKVCARWVSRHLASEPHEGRMDACQELLGRY